MPGQHSEHGPSAAPRWASCPGSVLLSRGYANRSSPEAKEGTLAHAAAEDCLSNDFDASHVVDAGYTYDVSDEGEPPELRQLPAEHAAYVQEYVDLCRDLPGRHFVEQHYPLDPWVPDNFGTSDHTAVTNGRLIVTDLKFGQGVQVFAENNEQLLCYALGAYETHSAMHDIREITMRISQPRLGHFDEWTITVRELLSWANYLNERYRLSLTPEAPLVPGQKQCQFCLAAAECPALYEATRRALDPELDAMDDLDREIADGLGAPAVPREPIRVADAQKLDERDFAHVLEHRKLAEMFFKRVEARALEAAQAGRPPPGWKLVEGRSNRQWRDEKEAEETLKSMRIKQEKMYSTKLASPAQVEKVVGKRQRRRVDALIVKPPGPPTLAPESDPRPALPSMTEELDDFDDLDDLDLGLEEEADTELDDLGL